MTNTDVCPSIDKLSNFAFGRLADREYEAVSRHLATCVSCQERLETADDSSDGIVQGLRQEAPVDAILFEPECEMAVDKCIALEGANFSKDHRADLGSLREYRLERELGHGGMGTVFEATHTRLNRQVAIKVLPPARMKNPESVRRFHREMQAVGNLDHRNIVRAYDAGEDDGQHFLVMEFVDGLDLSDVARRLGPLPIADACELIRKAAQGLEYAHQARLVHRDVKPSNIMATTNGEVKVLDLGLALLDESHGANEELTSTGQVMGTLDYMAPEQLGDSHDVDCRADIYGLGATLYRLLTGQAPYANQRYNTPPKKLMAIATKPYTPVSAHRDDVPKGLLTILDRMLAKNPDERFASAGEVSQALFRFARGSDISALVESASTAEQTVEPVEESTLKHVSSALVDTLPGEQPREKSPLRRWPPRVNHYLAATAVTVFCVLLTALLFKLRTPDGTLIVTIKEPLAAADLVVEIDGERAVDVSATDGGKILRVAVVPGQHALRIRTAEGMELITERFTLERGGMKIVSAEFTHGQAFTNVDVAQNTGLEIIPQQLTIAPRSPMAKSAMVTKPAVLPGVLSWTIATREASFAEPVLRFSHDGSQLAIGCFDGQIRIRDAATDRLTRILVGHDGEIHALKWAPDDPILASGGTDRKVRLWDARSGSLLRVLTGHTGTVRGVAWFPDGNTFASVGPELNVWDTATGRLLESVSMTNPPEAGHSLDCIDNRIAVASGEAVIIWDANTMQVVHELRTGYQVGKVEFSPDSNFLSAASRGLDNKTSIWSSQSGERLREFDAGGPSAWSPDGKSILAGGVIWNADSGNESRNIPELPRQFNWLDWSPQGGRIAFEDRNATVYACSLANPEIMRVHRPHPTHNRADGSNNFHHTVAFSATDPSVITTGFDAVLKNHPVFRWAMSDGRLNVDGMVDYHVASILSLGAGNYVYAGRWHQSNHEVRHAFRDEQSRQSRGLRQHQDVVFALARSPDSKFVVSGSRDGTARVWDIHHGQQIHEWKHESPVYALSYAPSGDLVATVASESVRVWDPQTGKEHIKLDVSRAKLAAFSVDSTVLAVINGLGAIELWDIANARQYDVLEGTYSAIRLMKWLNQTTIITYNEDNAVYFWDASSDKTPPKKVEMPGAWCVGAAFSHIGSRIALSSDQVLRTVDLATGRSRAHVPLRNGQYLTVSEDGHYAGSPRVERHFVYVVLTENGQELYTPDEFANKFNWKNNPDAVQWSVRDSDSASNE